MRGYPLPDIQWFKGRDEIRDDSLGSGVKYIIVTSQVNAYNRKSSLTIFNLNYNDDGDYYCRANNSLFEYRQQNSNVSIFRVHCKCLMNKHD